MGDRERFQFGTFFVALYQFIGVVRYGIVKVWDTERIKLPCCN